MEDLVIKWNNRFPLDFWYRRKYGISFNSLEHRSISQLDVFFEYVEEILYQKELIVGKKEQKYRENKELFRTSSENDERLQKIFDELDPDIFNK